MKLLLSALAAAVLLTACGKEPEPPKAAAPAAALKSGVDLAGMDKSVRPQDNYYDYANGTWLRDTQIPPDEVGWGSYDWNFHCRSGVWEIAKMVITVDCMTTKDIGWADIEARIAAYPE